MVLGVGNILFSDEGVGVRVAHEIMDRYELPENVSVVDGGVLGINLLGTISSADHLIVVDAVRNDAEPGTLHRLAGEEIPARVLRKNSLHQVDLLESLTLCQALDKQPRTVIVGVEPYDIRTLCVELTEVTENRVEDLIGMVLDELDQLGIQCTAKGMTDNVPRSAGQNNQN